MMEEFENYHKVEEATGSIGFALLSGACSSGVSVKPIVFMKIGDNPDAGVLRRLMPGVEVRVRLNLVIGQFEGEPLRVYDEKNPWDEKDPKAGFFKAYIKAGKTTFTAYVVALDERNFHETLKLVGGLRAPGQPQAGFWERCKLVLRWYWLRRPRLVTFKVPPL